MYKIHYDVYLATMKPTGAFVTKHTAINYVNQLAPAQQLACLNATPLAAAAAGASDAGAAESDAPRKPFQKRQIERASPMDRTGGGFRSTRPSRGGRMVPSLTIQIPNTDAGAGAGADGEAQVKGNKNNGSVKVQNQFAGLDVD
jgi:hypothetical protein